jgi:hypothetical protein
LADIDVRLLDCTHEHQKPEIPAVTDDNVIPLQVAILAAGVSPQIADMLRVKCMPRTTPEARTGAPLIDRAVFRGLLEELLDENPVARLAYEAQREQDRFWKSQQARIDTARAELRRKLGYKESK